jgi:L-fucono-1,5-lactonase
MTSRRRRIDAHQHFWRTARGDYGWLTPDLKPLFRNFLPEDLDPMLKKHGIEGTVLVQAAPTLAETEFLLSLADQAPFIKGVVGWVDFEAKDASEQIERLSKHPALVSIRPMIQDLPDDTWMLKSELAPAFSTLEHLSLTFDALTLPRHLQNLLKLLDRHPALRVVIDHASKPDIRSGDITGWASDIAELGKNTSAYCKLSGLVTEAADDWTVNDLKPVVDHLLETFGPERLIWGSDWPVCTLAAGYTDWVSATDHLLSGLTTNEADRVWYNNAVEAYQLDLQP